MLEGAKYVTANHCRGGSILGETMLALTWPDVHRSQTLRFREQREAAEAQLSALQAQEASLTQQASSAQAASSARIAELAGVRPHAYIDQAMMFAVQEVACWQQLAPTVALLCYLSMYLQTCLIELQP